MAPHFSVVTVRMRSGEHMPLMVNASTGLGIFEPTAYALSLRSRNRSVNTIGQALRAVQLLYQILAANKVDLRQRIKSNELLTLAEVEAVVEQCKLKKHDLDELHHGPVDEKVARMDIARLKKGRKSQAHLQAVNNNTAVVRIKYIKGYLAWLVEYAYLQRIPADRELFKKVADWTVKAIDNRVPTVRKRNSTERRRGLTHENEARVLGMVEPDSASNPWKDVFVRERNYLILRFLLGTGVRKAEMLGIKVNDLNFAENTVLIARRPDDPEDPRRRQPNTKTFDRVLLLGADLVLQLKHYLNVVRGSIAAARKHPYVFVSEAGAPLALNSIDYLFSVVQGRLPDIEQLSAHILRHTWNDRFSELVEGRMSAEDEKKVRNYVMGWSETSRSAENYTARYVEKQAHKALIELQQKMFKGKK